MIRKIIAFFILLFLAFSWNNIYANTGSGELIIPENLDFTKRYMLEEMKNLRIELEAIRREMQIEMNKKQIETIDKALSYSANTVNYFFVLITIAIMAIGIFWWKSIRDVKNRWNNSFEKEIQKSIYESQRKLQDLEKEQIRQSQKALLDQKNIMKKQESWYLWSQYNREESLREKLRLLEQISELSIEDELLSIQKEKSHLYIGLEMWEKALNVCEDSLEAFENETTFLINQAIATLMLWEREEAVKVIHDAFVLDPGLKEDIIDSELLKPIKKEMNKL